MGVRVRAPAAMARGRDVGQRIAELSVRVEKCVRPVAPQPGFELHQAFGIREVGDRHLVRAPGALDRLAIADHAGDNPIGVVKAAPCGIANLRQRHGMSMSWIVCASAPTLASYSTTL
jgi:hypothetical protein